MPIYEDKAIQNKVYCMWIKDIIANKLMTSNAHSKSHQPLLAQGVGFPPSKRVSSNHALGFVTINMSLKQKRTKHIRDTKHTSKNLTFLSIDLHPKTHSCIYMPNF